MICALFSSTWQCKKTSKQRDPFTNPRFVYLLHIFFAVCRPYVFISYVMASIRKEKNRVWKKAPHGARLMLWNTWAKLAQFRHKLFVIHPRTTIWPLAENCHSISLPYGHHTILFRYCTTFGSMTFSHFELFHVRRNSLKKRSLLVVGSINLRISKVAQNKQFFTFNFFRNDQTYLIQKCKS